MVFLTLLRWRRIAPRRRPDHRGAVPGERFLEPDAWRLWLGETEGEAAGLLHPSSAPLRLWRVSTVVNRPAHEGAALLEAV